MKGRIVLYSLIRNIILITSCHILFHVKYENLEILDKYNKCLICPNHSRIFDPAFLYPKVENMYSVAKSELFKNKLIAKFLTYHNAFPIERNKTDIKGAKSILEQLENQEKIRLLIFPEGGIFKENYKYNKRKTKSGAVYLSALANVPIIPVHITVRPKFFSTVTVTFGDAIFPDKAVLKNKKLLKENATKLINQIYDIN